MPQVKINGLFKINVNCTPKRTIVKFGIGLGLILYKEFVEKRNGEIAGRSKLYIDTINHFAIPKQNMS